MSETYYMACLDLRGRRCVVVGGGAVGLEKTRGLLLCGADVLVVSPRTHDDLLALDVTCRRGRYRRSDLDGAFLVVAATSDRRINERVHRDAEARGMLCNVADVPDLCNFILPAVHREGPTYEAVWDKLVDAEKQRDPDKKGFAVLIRIERVETLRGEPLND